MDTEETYYKRKINYYETDKMGIVHHSNYIRFFEEARLDMLEKFNLNYKIIEDMEIISPVMFVECKYLVPLIYGDEIKIYSKVVKFDGIKMEFKYEIYKDTTLCTVGHTGHCFLDKNMKPFRMKRLYPELYCKFKEMVQKN